MAKKSAQDCRLVCTRLSRTDYPAFLDVVARLGCSKSRFIREAIVAALGSALGGDYRDDYPNPQPAPPPVMPLPPMHIQPRTKAPYRGDGTAVRPVEGQRMGSVRTQGALLKPARPPKDGE